MAIAASVQCTHSVCLRQCRGSKARSNQTAIGNLGRTYQCPAHADAKPPHFVVLARLRHGDRGTTKTEISYSGRSHALLAVTSTLDLAQNALAFEQFVLGQETLIFQEKLDFLETKLTL